MKISVLMSFYNAEPFLAECLQSIIDQTETDWELIAVNNFATDESEATLHGFAERDSRIHVLRNREEGIIQALRMALKNSTGRLITRMDADDIMPPRKFEFMKEALQEHGPGHLVTGLVRYFTHEGEVGGGFLRYADWLNQLTRRSTNFSEIYRECVIPSPAWMCYREDLLAAGAFEPHTYPEDYDLCFRFYRQGLQVLGLSELLHHWRDYPSRTSRTDERYADQLYFHLKVPWFLKLDHDPARPLLLWGAGSKGKTLARHLQEAGATFHWITGNPRKQGKHIYGHLLQPESLLEELEHPQVLIAVTAPEAIKKMEERMKKEGRVKGRDVFYFC